LRVQELVTLGRQIEDSDLLLEAFHCSWSTAMFRGDHATAQKAIDEGIARYDPLRHAWMGAVFGGHDPGVCGHGTRANWLAMSGLREEARISMERAVSLAESLRHTPSLSQCLQTSMITCQISDDHEATLRMTQRMLELADKHGLAPQRAHALFHRGWALTCGADPAEGLEIMEAELPRASAGAYRLYYAALLARTWMKVGRNADALALVESALATVAEAGMGFYVPELHRLRGESLLQIDGRNSEKALRSLEAAVDVAKRQGAMLFQFRAAVSLARACAAAGNAQRGIGPLRELRAALPHGFEAAETPEAYGLLLAQ
jgi:predicted ATPase